MPTPIKDIEQPEGPLRQERQKTLTYIFSESSLPSVSGILICGGGGGPQGGGGGGGWASRGRHMSGAISGAEFAILTSQEKDPHIRRYYLAMMDSDAIARAVIMKRYQEQPYGLILDGDGYCCGFNRPSSTQAATVNEATTAVPSDNPNKMYKQSIGQP